MQYRELLPSTQLSRWVRCYWILEGVSPRRTEERVFPDGCMELVVHVGEPFASQLPDGTWELQARVMLHGQLEQFALLRPPHHAYTIGIRFRPAGPAGITHVPLRELLGRSVALGALQMRSGDELLERLSGATTDAALVRTLDGFLLAHFDPTRAADPLVEHCVQAIENAHVQARIGDLAAKVGLSPRQLQRRFGEHVGLTPKTFATITRFQRVFRLVDQERRPDLTQAAIAAGYFDQAHFIRNFRMLAGVSPSRFFRNPGSVAPHFVGH